MSHPAAISMRARNLMPLFDLFLIVTLAVYGIAGFEHLSKKGEAQRRSGARSDVGGNPAGMARSARHFEDERLGKRLQALNREAAALREALAAENTASTSHEREASSQAANPSMEEAGKLDASLARMQAELDRLSTENEGHEKQISALAALRSRIAGLEAQLQNARAMNGTLRDEITETANAAPSPPVISVESTPLMNASTGRTPVYLVFSKGHMLQLREPFYTFRQEAVQRANGRFELLERASRKSADEPGKVIPGKDSVLLRVLSEVQADTQYIVMLVDRASFGAFRQAREEIRRRNLRFGWEPLLRTDTVVLSASGQVIGEEVGARPR